MVLLDQTLSLLEKQQVWPRPLRLEMITIYNEPQYPGHMKMRE
jgi:hypothetical protein